jgi:hypothetical protein
MTRESGESMTPPVEEIEAFRRKLERAKQNTLVETNAQAISETLRQLRASRNIHQRRWIWELIQNAADATDVSKGKNRIEINLSERSLVFRHDGAPFDEDELSHLIYHGSTKQADPTKKGKFGSGFIAIHLVSEKVKIGGTLTQVGGSLANFCFDLDRSGTIAAEIQDHMETAWDECLRSMAETLAVGQFSTSFECELLSEQAREAVATGLKELDYVAPHVLALVDELAEISVVSAQETVQWRKVNEERYCSVICSDIVRESPGGLETHRIATIGDFHTSTAVVVLLHAQDERWTLLPATKVPRLFYPLPLVGTDNLPLPFAIVSSKFEPTESRNGIWAGSDVESSVSDHEKTYFFGRAPQRPVVFPGDIRCNQSALDCSAPLRSLVESRQGNGLERGEGRLLDAPVCERKPIRRLTQSQRFERRAGRVHEPEPDRTGSPRLAFPEVRRRVPAHVLRIPHLPSAAPSFFSPS